MSGSLAASRYGQDGAARFATSTELLLEAEEMPYEPMYQPLVPFYPPSITSGGAASSSTALLAAGGDTEWKAYPDRLDLFWYQGDDIQIPLYFQNPGDPALDMSNENGYTWKSEIRYRHRYFATEVNEFTIESAAVLPTPPSVTPTGVTLVTLFLPRQLNGYIGVWSWDLMSTSPYEGPVFPKPPDIPAEDWPPTDQVKTWLYGYIYVVPRVTSTDHLPVPPNALPPQPLVVSPAGYGTIGPNGRVP